MAEAAYTDPKWIKNLPAEPEDSWKACTRVRGERSLQFYGLRRGFKWKLSDKTRDTVTQMRKRFGNDLDVITLMGHVDPQPFSRSWKRFESEFEVVDLGRNRKVAQGLLRLLNAQAEEEEQLRKAASGETEQEIYRELVEARFAAIRMGERVGKRLVSKTMGLSRVARESYHDDTLTDLCFAQNWAAQAVELLKDVRAPLAEEDQSFVAADADEADKEMAKYHFNPEALLPAVHKRMASIQAALVDWDAYCVTASDDPFETAYLLASQRQLQKSLKALKHKIGSLEIASNAREVLRKRTITATSVAAKLTGV